MTGFDLPGHPSELLSAYLDGELSAPERSDVEAHLATCPTCGAELEALRGISLALRRLRSPDPPAGLVERALVRLPRRLIPMAWAAAAAAALAVGFVAAGNQHQERPPSVDRLVQVHATSTGRDPLSGLAPVSVRGPYSR